MHGSFYALSKREQRQLIHGNHMVIVYATIMTWLFLGNTLVAANRWRGKNASFIYTLYLLQSLFGLGLAITTYYTPLTNCHAIIYACVLQFYLSDLCAMLIILYKAYLVSSRQLWLLFVTFALELTTIVTIVWSMHINPVTRIGGICQQQLFNTAPFAIRGLLSIVKNALLCSCLFIPTGKQKKSLKRSPLSRLVIRDGVIYLVIMAWITIVCSTFSAIYNSDEHNVTGMVFVLEVLAHSFLLRIQFTPRHINSLDL
ncbi:hypothetical protein BDF22DRAFT_743606 [Syncephalis plumigaleata]|nr:hypothetical protein BDF22DRAFT_743606 [Syncephalis plumigaleata]